MTLAQLLARYEWLRQEKLSDRYVYECLHYDTFTLELYAIASKAAAEAAATTPGAAAASKAAAIAPATGRCEGYISKRRDAPAHSGRGCRRCGVHA